ncbi:MAG: ATP-binding cassette domain-containing protein [Proteobacteria bacterium]|nr:ATP-binding cassette domain-containing protein [Pseudomonadota bacterium]
MMRDTPSILPLAAKGLVFAADGRRLLHGIDVSIPRGERLALVGPNGAGKSLTLRLLHGLLTPAAGSVQWSLGDGCIDGRKRHALVFQKPVMLRRSVLANIEHALAAAHFPRRELRGRAEAALARFGLDDLAHRPARVLSGGEQQRLAITRAAALEPDLLFLDEPTSALDPGATRQVEAMLDELHGSGVTLVFSTHDLGQARRMARHVAVMNKGRIIEYGPAGQVLDAPHSAAARAFVAGDLLW